MRVLVAGSTGALGLPTVRRLVERGHDVFGLTHSQGKADVLARLACAAGDR
jgi:nucleoside-diphosphate-sugar epimerase